MSSYGRHNKFQKEVMIYMQLHNPKLRIWNNATGAAYDMPSVKKLIKAIMSFKQGAVKEAIKDLRLIKYGKVGSADITGILPDGRRIEIEIKTGKAVQSKDQKIFQKIIEERNGVYLLVSDKLPIKEQVSYEHRC